MPAASFELVVLIVIAVLAGLAALFAALCSGALAFKRSGNPAMGSFNDAVVLKKFGEVPDRLGEL